MPETPSHDPAGTGPSRAGGSIEARLRAAREARGLSLTDVQQETRIPADVLQRLEDGRLLGDASFNPVYLKALLKAYAGAVGLPAAEVLEGFDPGADRLVAGPPHAVVAGTTPAPAVEPPPPPPEPSRRPDARRVDVTPRTSVPAPPATPAPGAKPSAARPSGAQVSAPIPTPAAGPAVVSHAAATPSPPAAGSPRGRGGVPPPESPPASPALASTRASIPTAESASATPVSGLELQRTGSTAGDARQGKHRVMSAEAARTPRAFHRSWGLMIGGTLALVGIFALALFLLFRDRTPQPERRPQVAAADTSAPRDTVQTDTAEPPPTSGPTFVTPIRITVTAGAGGLQNFRVTAEPQARVGHWVEEGQSVTFESPTAVVLWGEGAEGLNGDAALELQGLRWTPADGRVLRIDAQNGQRLLDSLSGAGPARPATNG